jgi:Bacterial regulatory protein, arsR family
MTRRARLILGAITTITAPDGEVERTEIAPAAALFRSLGDPARLMIVRRLASGPARVTDLVAALGLASPGNCDCWLPAWLPGLSAPLAFE